jgi:hypothetical protein
MELWEIADLATPWALHVAATLRVADHIAAGTTDIHSLAEACHCDADYLSRVLRHLVEKGVFESPARGQFALNDTAKKLLDEGQRAGLDLNGMGGRMANAWSTLLTAVLTGRPAYQELFGRNFWDDLEAHPAIAEGFDIMMGPGHGAPDPEILLNPADWADVRTVVDVGGGTGSLLAAILRARPEVRGILVDLPRPIAGSAEVFQAAGVSDRAAASAQSFFDPLPKGAELYVMKSVLADWPDREALEILKRCAEAARPSGRVVVFTATEPDKESDPELLMLVLVGGKGRSLTEFTELASQAGLKVVAAGRQPNSGKGIVECRPVGTA